MGVGTWFVCWIICTVFGTYSITKVRHFLVEGTFDKSKVKFLDLTVAILVGLIPVINIFLAELSIIMSLFFIGMKVYSLHSDFFNRDLFVRKRNKE